MLSIMNMHKIYKNMNSLSDNRLRISTKKMTKPLVDTFVPLTILQLLRNLSLTKKEFFFFSFLSSLDPQYKSHNYKVLIKDVIGLLIIWIAQNSLTPQLVFYGQKQQRPQ
jgi:hypothetical protein